MPSLPVIIGVAAICALLGAAIGSNRGQGAAGFWLGLFLGPLGLLLCLTMKTTPAAAAARAEAIEVERARLRAGQGDAAQQPTDG